MEEQKQAVMEFVKEQKAKGYTVTDALNDIKIKRSTYYSWARPKRRRSFTSKTGELTPCEKTAIEEVKKEYPHLRHRQIQGILQQKGLYLSFSSVYHHLKSLNMVEPYERRPSPLKEPRYAVWRRNLMWGCDWTRLLINHLRWYLLILIDFFSRYVIAYGIFPSINASHVRHIYSMGLKEQGIRKGHDILPELRVDRGSPNTSLVTREFFEIIGADLSFARVRRPTDNALTERFFGTAKQEEIYLVGSYPDERSAWEETGSYIYTYNNERPHQSLWNFTPAYVHEVNNNTLLLEELARLKETTRLQRRQYWEQQRLANLHTKDDLQNYAILSKREKT
jgi:transposase InsO family protein